MFERRPTTRRLGSLGAIHRLRRVGQDFRLASRLFGDDCSVVILRLFGHPIVLSGTQGRIFVWTSDERS